tara:strand:+ start:878 stop:1153 length:276 start_codon:yes stop_codon:yes gene_type:complete
MVIVVYNERRRVIDKGNLFFHQNSQFLQDRKAIHLPSIGVGVGVGVGVGLGEGEGGGVGEGDGVGEGEGINGVGEGDGRTAPRNSSFSIFS